MGWSEVFRAVRTDVLRFVFRVDLSPVGPRCCLSVPLAAPPGLPLLLDSSQSAWQLPQIPLRDSQSLFLSRPLSLPSPPSPSPTLSLLPSFLLSSTSFQVVCATLLPAGNEDGVSQSPLRGAHWQPEDRTSGLHIPAGPAPCPLPEAAHAPGSG